MGKLKTQDLVLGIGGIVAGFNVACDLGRIMDYLSVYGRDGYGAYMDPPRETLKSMEKQELISKLNCQQCRVFLGVARFAIYGRPAITNTPPFRGCKGKYLVVGRGALRDPVGLRISLMERGHVLESKSTVSLLTHLLEESLERDSLSDLLGLEGAFSLVAYSPENEEMYLVVKGLYEFLGTKDEQIFVSSEPDILDFCGFREFKAITNAVVVLRNDGSLDILRGNIYDVDFRRGKIVGGFNYFMEREIAEIPRMLEIQQIVQNSEYMEMAAKLISRADNVYLIGSGSSYHSVLYGAYLMNEVSELKPMFQNANEFVFFMLNKVNPGDVIIANSQSGRTRDVIHAVARSRMKGALIIGIINMLGTPLMYASNVYIPIVAGIENAVPATKTVIAQMVTFARLASYLGMNNETYIRELRELPKIIRRVELHIGNSIERFVEKIKNQEDFFVLGRGIDFPVALEGALKLKEVAQIHAEGMDAGEFRHGTKTLAARGYPVVVLIPRDMDAREDTYDLINEISDTTNILVITDENDPYPERFGVDIVRVPAISEYLTPILYLIPLQKLALELGKKKSKPIDSPPKLTKYIIKSQS